MSTKGAGKPKAPGKKPKAAFKGRGKGKAKSSKQPGPRAVKVVAVVPPKPRGKSSQKRNQGNPAVNETVKRMVLAMEIKSKHCQAMMDQLLNPATAPLHRVNPGGVQATTIKSALCRLPIRIHMDLVPILNRTAAGGPTLRVGGEVVPVWAYSGADKYMQYVLTDDPVVPLIYPVYNPAASTIYELPVWVSGVQAPDGKIELWKGMGIAQPLAGAPSQRFSFQLAGPGWVSNAGAYGYTHPFGCSDDGKRYFWVDANETLTATVTMRGTFTYPVGCDVNSVIAVGSLLTSSDGPTHAQFVDVVCTNVTGSIPSGTAQAFVLTLSQSGYYSFRIDGNVAIGGADLKGVVTFSPATTSSYEVRTDVVSRHVVHEAFAAIGESGAVSQVRVLGTSVLLSNTTPQLFKGGSAVGYCASGQTDFWFDKASEPAQLETVNDQFYFRDNWAKGIYSYVKPRRFGVVQDVQHQSGRRKCFHGDFGNPDGWNLIMVQPSLSDYSPMNVSLPLIIQLHSAFEFWTDNPVFHVEGPTFDVESYELFIAAALRLSAPFSCNPGHLSMIWNAIRSASRYAGSLLLPYAESAVKFSKALQDERPISSVAGLLGL